MLESTLTIESRSQARTRPVSILGRAFALALVVVISSGAALATPMLWGVDEDDGVLFSINDYTQISAGSTAAGLTTYGKLKWHDGSTVRTIGNDMEAFTLDASGMAYIALDDNLGSTGDQVLLRFDTNTATTSGDNVVTVLGRIAAGHTGNISGLSIDPLSGDLYALSRRSGADRLLKISKTDGSLLVDLGAMAGLGEAVCDGEDMEFDSMGNLYVTDNSDDELYRVDPSTGNIVAVIDNHQEGGLGGGSLKFEALAWDDENDRLVAFSDRDNFFADEALADGGNLKYGSLSGLTDVEGMDFVPVPEPATLGLILAGGLILPFRRKK